MASANVEIRLTRKAATELAELGPRRSGMLTIELGRRARSRLEPGLLAVWTAADLAACEVLAAGGSTTGPPLMLVCAVRSRGELAATLFGPELHRRFTARAIRHVLHHGLRGSPRG
jgi:hypothetical protein